MARPMLSDSNAAGAPLSLTSFRFEVLTMKDVLFLVATTAFFAVAWAYAKSFDQL